MTAQRILFDRYISDGPGYRGALSFEIKGVSIAQFNGDAGQAQETVDLCSELADVTDVQAMPADADLATALFWALPEAVRDYLESPAGVDADRVRLLRFADGSQGALVVAGEPCYYTLIAGDKAYEVAEGVLNEVIDLPAPFPFNVIKGDVPRPAA